MELLHFQAGLVLALLLLSQVDGRTEIFSERPESATVLVDRSVTFECATHKTDIKLTFTVNPPLGQQIMWEQVTSNLPNGGRKITTTFIVPKELNHTTVRCIAAGQTRHTSTDPATVYAYALSDHVDNIRIHQFGPLVSISWDSVFSPNGINISYRFTDNKGLDIIKNTPSVLFFHNEKEEEYSKGYTAKASQYNLQLYTEKILKQNYTANITVITIATAANQTGYGNVTNLTFELNRKQNYV